MLNSKPVTPLHHLAVKAAAIVLLFAFAPAPLTAADVGYYSASKGILFAQTNAGAPQLRAGLPFLFQAAAVPVSNGLSGATVIWIFGGVGLAPQSAGAPFTFTYRLDSQEELDAIFPNGNFTVNMTTVHDGMRSCVLGLTGDDYPPNAPSVVNYAQTQAINPSNDFTFRWSGFTGGTTNDFIFVQFDSSTGLVFRTAYSPGTPGALNGTNTSLLIPSNTFTPGRAYAGRVAFHKTAGTNFASYPGVTGAATYFVQTDFYVATTGAGDTTPPQLVAVSPPPGATNVPVNAPVVMTFSEPMRQALSIFSSPPPGGRAFAWSPDGLTLVATPTSNWPPNTSLAWVLNPFDGALVFGDLNRNPLPMETAVRFTTGTNTASAAAPMLTEPRRLVTGRFQFKLLGENGRAYAAEATTNFTDWVSLGTNIAFGGSLQFTDTNAPSLPRRYYRGIGF